MKKLKWVIVAVVVIGVIGAIGSSGGDSDNETKTQTEGSTDVSENDTSDKTETKEDTKKEEKEKEEKEEKVKYVKITSTKLIKAFKDNQVKCKRKYDGKNLKVTGKVQSVGTDVLDNIYVCLGSNDELALVGIQCYAKDKTTEDKIAELSEGDEITVTGVGDCGSLSFTLSGAEIID